MSYSLNRVKIASTCKVRRSRNDNDPLPQIQTIRGRGIDAGFQTEKQQSQSNLCSFQSVSGISYSLNRVKIASTCKVRRSRNDNDPLPQILNIWRWSFDAGFQTE